MADKQVTHKPGALKQSNKSHKTGRHRSKGQIQKEAGGRVNAKTLTKQLKHTLQKKERVNRIQQIRKQKRDEVLSKKRSRGTAGCPPFLVVIVPLCEGLDCKTALKTITGCDEELTSEVNDLGTCHINVPRFKQRFSFVTPEYGNLYALLDAVKVADSVLFLLSPEFGLDQYGDYCLSCLWAQGLPASVMAVQGLNSVPIKKQGDLKKKLQKQLKNRFPDIKLHGIDTAQDGLLLLRTVGNQKHVDIVFRERRPHMLAENVAFELDTENSKTGTLKVTGYLRGRALSANDLVHLPGWDTYQMIQIDLAKNPSSFQSANKRNNNKMEVGDTEEMDEDIKVLECADPLKQTSLQSEVELDPMDGEQTWPTEDEMAEAEEEFKKKMIKKTKRVPRGTSEYQASWIVESDEEEDEDEEAEDDDEFGEDAVLPDEDDGMDGDGDSYDRPRVSFASSCGGLETDETDSMILDGDATKYDKMIDEEEEASMLEKLKAAHQQQMFPDEVDTPQDVAARVRFQRYRGLKSFRTSAWDPKENLPLDYARIFQFENFKRSKKRALEKQEDSSGAMPGWYVTVHVANVPKEFMESYRPGHPIILFGLLEHEQKTSVIHFLLKRNQGNQQPVKSKERLVFHVGFRRFSACPIFSQHTNADKHKFERYLQDITVATVYAPVTFSPAPVMAFIDKGHGRHELVAQGSILSVNPDRIIAKRIILSGHPFKINKKTAVVRYMFFNREDIMWFKPVELRTKWGRRGHIKEPLGTHGHMKCTFDGQLKSQDTVLMNLYKRVYPKWTYQSHVYTPDISTSVPSSLAIMSEDTMDEMFD